MSDDDDEAQVHGVRLTNPDRIVFKDQGLSKRDLARYCETVAARMLPFVAERPLSLVRCPRGSDARCFFQKHASEGFPAEIRPVEITEADGERKPYLYVSNVEGLIAAVQMGTLEFHIWGSRIDSLEKPDRLVFDLDPGPGVGFRDVVSAAADLRDVLAEIGLASLPLVTGGKGVHVVAPLRRSADWGIVKAFAKGFAGRCAAREPDRFVATMAKAKRQGRIFIDWLRNERGATAVAPYSTRARAGAPVALPVGWDELDTLQAADGFGVTEAAARLDAADPWHEMPGWSQAITKGMLEQVRQA